MKKALSLILSLAMAVTLLAVPVMAEEAKGLPEGAEEISALQVTEETVENETEESAAAADEETEPASGEDEGEPEEDANTIKIASVDDFIAFAKESQSGNSFSGKTVKLVNDIDFEGANYLEIAEDGKVVTDYRIPKFSGVFDGDGYTIKNFNFVVDNCGKNNIMMFSQDNMWAYIKNLNIENVTVSIADISGTTKVTALANRINAGGMTSAAIENVHISNYKVECNNTTSDELYIGGLVYFVQGSQLIAKDCSITGFEVDVNSATILGGAVCVVKSKCDFENVDVADAEFNVGNIEAIIGGFAGQTQDNGTGTTFTDCDVTNLQMTLGNSVSDVGGFIAQTGAASQFYNCTTSGSITVTDGTDGLEVGGFVGNLGWNGMGQPDTQHEFDNCVADMDITAVNANVGGFIGDSTIQGYPERFIPAYFNNCEAMGDVKTENGVAGGFVGRGDRGIFNDCSALGDVEGRIAGGFWGEIYPKASAESKGGWSYDKKEVTHSDVNSKAIVLEGLTVEGTVTGTEYEADLIGYMKDIYVENDGTVGYATPIVLANNSTSDINRYPYPVKTYEVSTKAELDAALVEVNDDEKILLVADIDYGSAQLKIEKAVTLDLGGYTLTNSFGYGGIVLKNNPSVINGTIDHQGGVAAIKAWNVASLEDLTITVAERPGKTVGGIVIQEGSQVRIDTIRNVTINGAGLTNGIETYNCGNAANDVIGSMENVTIDATGTGMLISAPCGTATDCTISGGTTGIEIWIKGTYSAALELVNCEVSGDEQAVYAHDEFSSNPDVVNDGTIQLDMDDKTALISENGTQFALTAARIDIDTQLIVPEELKNFEAEVNNTYYSSFEDALNAAKEGGKVTLLVDINLNEVVKIAKGETVTLDLAGHTITGIDETSKSFGLFTNSGNLTIEDSAEGGKITLASTINSGWNRYSSVLSNNPGGKLVVNGGVIEHLGGTDMAYAIDNLTNGKGTYAETVINGGTVKSTYRAVRQFLNGVEAQNILTVNGGVVEGSNKAIWMQDPSKNANTGTLNVNEGATVNGDVYLSVTEGSTEWPVDVNIVASAVNGEVLSSNVPYGYHVEENNGVYGVNYRIDLPTATVTTLGNVVIDGEKLTFARTFTADEVNEEQLAFYGKYYADFVISFNKDVTFNADGTADGYLAGQYDAFSENWVKVPFEDITIKAGESLNIMEYALELMGYKDRITYELIYDYVKEFNCGVFFSSEFLAANPDIEVTLELVIFDPEKPEEKIVIGEMEKFEYFFVEVDGVQYKTLQEAFDAATEGATVNLLGDMTLTESVTVAKGKEIVLDLAGNTITGVDTTTKNFGLISNNGNLTVNDTEGTGKITLQSDVNSGWNRYSAVISNNPGGVLTVNGGTIQHLGGTDMAYGIDALTNSNIAPVTTTINGGTVKSTYRGIRQFLNSTATMNSLTINGGVVEGDNKAIFFHDPSTKANVGALTIGGNADVNGGVYLFVTEGSAEWPVEVSIAANAVDEVTSKNVPAGLAVEEVNGIYSVVECTYAINFVVGEHGTTEDATEFSVKYGETVVAPEITPEEGWRFIGWDNEVVAANGNATYTAQYERIVYIITFDAGEGGTIAENVKTVEAYYGDVLTVVPIVTCKPGYKFIRWEPEVSTLVTEDATYTAVYERLEYTVTFDAGEHGTIEAGKETFTGYYGDEIIAPEITEIGRWAHTGWDKELNTITGNETFTAQYTELAPIPELAGLKTRSVSFNENTLEITAEATADKDYAGVALVIEGAAIDACTTDANNGITVSDSNGYRYFIVQAEKGEVHQFNVYHRQFTYKVTVKFVDENLEIPFKDILTLRASSASYSAAKKQVTVVVDRYKYNLASSTYGISIVPNDGEKVEITYNRDENGDGVTQIFKKFNSDKYTSFVTGVNAENGGGAYGKQPIYIIDRGNGTRVYLDVTLTTAEGTTENYTIQVRLTDLAKEGDVDITEILPLRADANSFVIDNEAKTIYYESSTAFSSTGFAVAVDNGLNYATRPRRLVTAVQGYNLAHGEFTESTENVDRFDRYVVARLSKGTEQTYKIKVHGGEDGLTYSIYTVTVVFKRNYQGDIEFTELLTKNVDAYDFNETTKTIDVYYSSTKAILSPVVIDGCRLSFTGGISSSIDGNKAVAVKSENGSEQTVTMTLKVGNDTTDYTIKFHYIGE